MTHFIPLFIGFNQWRLVWEHQGFIKSDYTVVHVHCMRQNINVSIKMTIPSCAPIKSDIIVCANFMNNNLIVALTRQGCV